jgi:hypothetical protein
MLFKNSVRTSKRTPDFTITKINWLMLFKEIIAVYSENHTKPINTKCSITDCKSRWLIWLPLGLKGLRIGMVPTRPIRTCVMSCHLHCQSHCALQQNWAVFRQVMNSFSTQSQITSNNYRNILLAIRYNFHEGVVTHWSYTHITSS